MEDSVQTGQAAPADAASPPVLLKPDALRRAFPFLLRLDAQLNIIEIGSSLAKALPLARVGRHLHDVFRVTNPVSSRDPQQWRCEPGALCTLRPIVTPQMMLRGSIEPMDDGSVLLLVSPVFASMDHLSALGLRFSDFARHDAVTDLLIMARSMQRAAHDTQRMARRLRDRGEQLNAMLDLSVNGMGYFGPDGLLRLSNARFADLLELESERMPGLRLSALDQHLATLRAGVERGQLALAEWEQAGAPDEPIHLCLGAADPRHVCLRLRHTHEGGTVVYVQDTTREAQIDRMKSEFLSTAAHELRTPMASIFGYTELLLFKTFPPEEQRAFLQTIHNQTALLVDMVNELLDLARIEAGREKEFRLAPTRLDTIVARAQRAIAPAAARHELRIDPALGDAMLMVDPAKTHRAVLNVLSNAVKYAPNGGVIHVTACREQRAGRAMIGLRIEDQGIGMTAQQLERVFERFYRADPSGEIPGTGLGMSLVKEIMELQRGEVSVCSEPGVGTCVTLWFAEFANPAEAGACRDALALPMRS
ncbi:MAG TPA: ATP-binding protein [Burkholderiaceae bacterium]|nr:ATP-binding protein [Burkholderiaceae bacterium]